MRLLNVESFELVEFDESTTPPYIAISHTWDAKELTFADWHKPERENRAGFAKVRDAAATVKENGQMFMWIDTCCIDKSSSAELSEAINSMFKWYAAAQACYVYMTDVTITSKTGPPDKWPFQDRNSAKMFEKSRWFTRGWTLQELVAPKHVTFYSRDWDVVGTKQDMAYIIAQITRIQPEVLRQTDELSYVSVAGRMSWASERVTTRTEDLAYCLLGIFGVNMPLLYGEGKKAFIRLQEQIMREIDDQSLFAWVDRNANSETLGGMLATHPKFFRHSGRYMALNEIPAPGGYTLTNKGLSISLMLRRIQDRPGYFLAPLDCAHKDRPGNFAAIILKSISAAEPVYCRVITSHFASAPGVGQRIQVFVRQNLLTGVAYRNLTKIKLGRLYIGEPAQLVKIDVPDALREVAFSTPSKPQWMPDGFLNGFGLLRTPGSVAAMLKFRFETGDLVVLCLGRDKDGDLGCHVGTTDWKVAPSQLEFTADRGIAALADGSYMCVFLGTIAEPGSPLCFQVDISFVREQLLPGKGRSDNSKLRMPIV